MRIESDRRDKNEKGPERASMTDSQGGKGNEGKDPFGDLSGPAIDRDAARKDIADRADTTKEGKDTSGKSADHANEQQRNHDLFGK